MQFGPDRPLLLIQYLYCFRRRILQFKEINKDFRLFQQHLQITIKSLIKVGDIYALWKKKHSPKRAQWIARRISFKDALGERLGNIRTRLGRVPPQPAQGPCADPDVRDLVIVDQFSHRLLARHGKIFM